LPKEIAEIRKKKVNEGEVFIDSIFVFVGRSDYKFLTAFVNPTRPKKVNDQDNKSDNPKGNAKPKHHDVSCGFRNLSKNY
jgi:hypothetical protein